MAVERNASLKNQSSLEENCENIIFAATQTNRKEKQAKKESNKKKKKESNSFASQNSHMMTHFNTNLFCTRGTRN